MTQHTPGPWSIEGYESVGKYIESASGNEVCEFHKTAYNPADAALIAAAPDLLETLRTIIEEVVNYPGEFNADSEIVSIARAAITKAEAQS